MLLVSMLLPRLLQRNLGRAEWKVAIEASAAAATKQLEELRQQLAAAAAAAPARDKVDALVSVPLVSFCSCQLSVGLAI